MRVFALCLAIVGAVTAYGQQRPDLPIGATPPPPGLKGPSLPGDAIGPSIEVSVTGRVLLEDRQAPPEPVQVDYSCRGKSLAVTTDVKGRFSVVVARKQVARSSLNNDLPMLEGCRVQVSVPGFEDIVVMLKHPRSMDDLNLGDLALRATAGQARALFSSVSGKAPNKARSSYIQALTEIGAGKYDQALASLDKALRQYPTYAAAFQSKGEILEMRGLRDEARVAYRAATEADPQYGKPMVRLAEMAADDQNSAEAAQLAANVNRAMPGAFPTMYLIEGSACFNLGRFDDAEQAARAGIAADRTNAHPRLHKLLGEVLYRKHDYSGAKQELERYVNEAPEAADAAEAKARAESAEKLARITRK